MSDARQAAMYHQGMESLGSILEREGGAMLQRARRLCRVSSMTTNENYDRIVRLVGGLVEDEAWGGAPNPKQAAAAYVENTLDNGWISSNDDTPVWELIEALGYDRNDMDEFAVFAEISELIEGYQLND